MLFIMVIILLSSVSLNLTTDILSPIPYIIKKVPIIHTIDINEIEKLYIENRSIQHHQSPNDAVCSLPKTKKIALCHLIFQSSHYPNNLNKVAFSIASLSCSKKTVHFKTLTHTPNNTLSRWMYPCHGRHNPIRTSFIEDDFYAKFYVSAGLDNNSVFVYVYQNEDNHEWFNIYSYFKNIIFNQLSDIFFTIPEITDELSSNDDIVRAKTTSEIEHIYYREKNFLPTNDPICDLPTEKIITLCQLMLSDYFYKTYLGVTLNMAAFHYLKPKCERRKIVLKSKNATYEQEMVNCYARNMFNFGNVLLDKYTDYYFLSSGTRRNSVFVYSLLKSTIASEQEDNAAASVKYSLFEIIENLPIQDLEPTTITEDDVKQESDITYEQISAILTKMRSTIGFGMITSKITKRLKHCQSPEVKRFIINTVETMQKDMQNLLNEFEKLSIDEDVKKRFEDTDRINFEAPTIEEIMKENKEVKALFEALITNPAQKNKKKF